MKNNTEGFQASFDSHLFVMGNNNNFGRVAVLHLETVETYIYIPENNGNKHFQACTAPTKKNSYFFTWDFYIA